MSFKRTVAKMQQESADKVVRYRLRNGMIATLTGIESEPYQAWVFNNANSRYRSSNGAKLHCLTQIVQGTLDAPYESWGSFKARGGDLLFDEFAAVETDSGVGAG
jgi:hypothetical protein